MRDVIKEGAYGVLPPGDSYDDSLPITFLRATELKPNLQIDFASCHRVSQEYLIRKARIKKGDVLLAVKGATIASPKSVAVIEHDVGDAVINGSIFRMHFKAVVDPKFAAVILDSPLMKKQMRLGLVANNGVDYLDKSLINRLVFPVPIEKVQQAVIGIYEQASSNFHHAQEKAAAFLASIDDYLLAELGITLPPEPDNTISNRIFTAQRRELAGFRFDARVHRADFDLVSTRFNNLPLKRIAEINPRTTFRNIEEQTRLTFVPMEAITDEDGTIVAPQERVFADNVGYTSFQEGDLLWAKITPCMDNGKSAVAEGLLNGFGFGSTEYHVFRPKSAALNIKYLHALLRMKRLRHAAKSYFGGSSGHQRVDEAFFAHLHIPLPDAAVQRHIVEELERRRADAKRLRAEAETELEIAKRRIEAMLLGEAA
jgi:type I restriction enzyme S subunit